MDSRGLLLIALSLFPNLCLGNVGPPVFLFKDARVESSMFKPLAGHTVSTSDFSTLLSTIKNPDIMITFLQDELSNEDFLRLDQNMKRGGLFKNVQKYSDMKTSTYFPTVKSPMHSLKGLTQNYDEQIDLKDASEVVAYLERTKPEKDTSIIIRLVPTAVDESSTAIKKNDEIIGQVMNLVEQSGLTYIAFFTGEQHRRAHESVVVQGVGRHLLESAAPETNNTQSFYNDTDCLVFIDSMKVNGEAVKDPAISCSANKNATTVDIGGKVVMVFATNDTESGMWYITDATSVDGETDITLPDISAPTKFSYHCSTYVKFINENGTVVLAEFKTIQIQVAPFITPFRFGWAYDCTGFFTIPLWTGLLTALFLLTVTGYGIYMLSNIQTFDQYDDPKAKPLIVNVSE